MTQALLVTLLSKGGAVLRTSVWDPSEPFGIGHPFQWTLESISNGVRVRDLSTLKVEEYKDEFINKNVIELSSKSKGNQLKVTIHPYRYSDLHPEFSPTWISTEGLHTAVDESLFKKAMRGTVLSVAALIILSFLMPHREVTHEELIPPQFAKILMTSTAKGERSKKTAQSTDEGKNKTTNIVRAFQSEQVKHSTQALLKGGVLSLLSKSNLLSNSRSQTALKSLFDQGKASQSLAKLSGVNEVASIAVGTQGGKASADGSSVGYGQGQKAGIEGQGKSFVSLDAKEASVEEGLTKEEVGNVIHSHVSEVRYCYESAMIKNPNIQGKLIVDFVIQGKGANAGIIKSARINNSTLNDVSVDQCILSHLTKWKFPKPKGGVEVAVTYPFLFKSLGK
ncbi:MAG: AgmX/PglI C-terminal domain-containing protein [Bdellovibrionia bacterium]